MKQKKKKVTQKPGLIASFFNSYAIFFLIVLFGSIYTFIAITKYIHYQTGLDIAIYIQTMWFYTHFQLPYVTLYPTFGDLVWADHFSPSLILLTPFYWLWSDPRTLLIIQSFAFVSGAYPLYRFAKEVLQNNFLALSLAFVFLISFGVQFPLTFDFHVATMAASFMAWILWAMFKGKWKTFVILCIIASGFKEDMPLYVVALSVYLIFSHRNWKLGIVMLPLSFGYAYYVTHTLMPSLAHNAAKVFSLSYFTLKPDYLVSVFVNSPIKVHTMFYSFADTLFFSVFSGLFLLLPITHFFINFSNPNFAVRWGIYMHYRTYLAAMMLYATILGLQFFTKKFPKIFATTKLKTVLAILFMVNAVVFDIVLHQPLNVLGKQQFYYKESWISDDNAVIKKIPANAYLLTVNNLAPQVAYRKNIFYYPQNLHKADYIFVDLHPNQPITNFWLTADNAQEMVSDIHGLLKTKEFHVVYKSHDAILLGRKVTLPKTAHKSTKKTSTIKRTRMA